MTSRARKPKPDEVLTVVIDTREQLPYAFPRSQPGTLSTGDYSALGFESEITVERKTRRDLTGCIGRSRKRFIRELERMTAFAHAAIVIECDLADLAVQDPITKVSPAQIINSLISWSQQYNVQVWLTSSRELGQKLTWQILRTYVRHKIDEGVFPEHVLN